MFCEVIAEVNKRINEPYHIDLVIVFFMLLGRYFQDKTYSVISFDRDYKSYFPVAVTKIGESEKVKGEKQITKCLLFASGS